MSQQALPCTPFQKKGSRVGSFFCMDVQCDPISLHKENVDVVGDIKSIFVYFYQNFPLHDN